MLGVSTKLVENFADHTMCRLGQWYYEGEGANKYSSLSAFKQLESPHAEVHKNGLAALKSYSIGDSKEAVKRLTLMESASFKVIDLLTTLSRQVESEMAKL